MKENTKAPASPFILSQLEEALEERQTPDRRKVDQGYCGKAEEERRKGDRRQQRKANNA